LPGTYYIIPPRLVKASEASLQTAQSIYRDKAPKQRARRLCKDRGQGNARCYHGVFP